MVHQTFLGRQEIQGILALYGIVNIISYKLLSGGSENTNYLVNTKDSAFVLTLCEQKPSQKANELTHLLEHLAQHHFRTSKIVRTHKNEAITYWNDKPVILKVFLKGKTMENLPIRVLELIGVELAKLHQIEAPDYLSKEINYGKEHFDEIEQYAPNSLFHIWIKDIQVYIAQHMVSDLPKTLIHSDLFYSNVIVSEDESTATIMDFEEAVCYYRVFDIGMTIAGLCSEGKKVNLKKVKSLLKGYSQEIKLLDVEQKALHTFTVYAAASMSFWRHKNFNYTNPDPDLSTHYLELKYIADYVRALPFDCFFV